MITFFYTILHIHKLYSARVRHGVIAAMPCASAARMPRAKKHLIFLRPMKPRQTSSAQPKLVRESPSVGPAFPIPQAPSPPPGFPGPTGFANSFPVGGGSLGTRLLDRYGPDPDVGSRSWVRRVTSARRISISTSTALSTRGTDETWQREPPERGSLRAMYRTKSFRNLKSARGALSVSMLPSSTSH